MLTKRALAATVATIAVLLSSAAPAQAAQASINPTSQQVGYGALAIWSGSYQGSGGGTATANFYYGNGGYFPQYAYGETVHEYQRSQRFYPCSSQSFKQEIFVVKNGATQAYASASTYVAGGGACR